MCIRDSRHAAHIVGDNGQRAIIGHGAEEDLVFQFFGVEVLGAALHPQLVAGAVVEHKTGLARRQRRTAIAALDAVEPGARAGVCLLYTSYSSPGKRNYFRGG